MDIIHLQAIVLWMSSLGLLVYSYIWPTQSRNASRVFIAAILMLLYAFSSTTLLGGPAVTTLFAPAMMWTGVVSLGAIIVIAWLAAPRLNWRILGIFFYATSIIALLSLLYGLPEILNHARLGGIVMQPNVLAVILGAGLIAGLYTKKGIRLRWQILASIPIVLAILLTQTRAVILTLPLVILPFVYMRINMKGQQALIVAGLIITGVLVLAPRLTNLDRLKYGVTYRSDLAVYSLQHLQVMPPWGFGPGGLSRVAGSFYSFPPSIEATILNDQKVPESSHVIFIDRFIEYGWLGGLSYLVIITLFVIQSIKKRQDSFVRVLTAIGSFVLIQQLITVPRFHMELIAWVAIFGVILHEPLQAGDKND